MTQTARLNSTKSLKPSRGRRVCVASAGSRLSPRTSGSDSGRWREPVSLSFLPESTRLHTRRDHGRKCPVFSMAAAGASDSLSTAFGDV